MNPIRIWSRPVLMLLVLLALGGCGKTSDSVDVADASPAGTNETQETAPAPWVGAGDMAPHWAGLDLVSDETVEFPTVLEGKPAVLVFWATWCPYCKAFMPYTEAMQWDYESHGVKIITFNAKERGHGDPKAYAQSLGFPLIAIADADNIATQYGVDFIPGLMVVNGEGRVIYRRNSTELPAGRTVAELWDSEVRAALDKELGIERAAAID